MSEFKKFNSEDFSAEERPFVCMGYTYPDCTQREQAMSTSQKLAMDVITNTQRPFMQVLMEKQAGVYFGVRFNDNRSVLLRILSVVPVEVMMKNPIEWVRAALIDCANSDHWYMFEKQWD